MATGKRQRLAQLERTVGRWSDSARGLATTRSNDQLLAYYEAELDRAWLRDSCSCSKCVDTHSGQKSFATTDVPPASELTVKQWAIENERGELVVTWDRDFNDAVAPAGLGGLHESRYDLESLPTVLETRPRHFVAWDRDTIEPRMRFIDWSDFMSREEVGATGTAGGTGRPGFWEAVADLLQLGIVFLRGLPRESPAAAEAAVDATASRLGTIQETFYGRTWDVVSKPEAENVAYTNIRLPLHQDILYLPRSPRLQVLHCIANDAEGGESVFSDGFWAVEQVRRGDEDRLGLLERLHIPYHYNRNGQFHYQSRPVVEMHGTVPRRINWSPPFQAPMPYANRLGGGDMMGWHAALRAFEEQTSRPENLLQYKMQAGECVIFDNARVLHGRTHFDLKTGSRWLRGSYVGEKAFSDAVLAKPDGLGLLRFPEEKWPRLDISKEHLP